MDALVWVDEWQMQCCGEPFSVGSRVSWGLVDDVDTGWLTTVLGAAQATAITHAEERHTGQPLAKTDGFVRRIRIVRYQAAPEHNSDPLVHYPVEGSGRLVEVADVDGLEEPVDGLTVGGYLVNLKLVDPAPGIRPARNGVGAR